jgi:hypothetical protein
VLALVPSPKPGPNRKQIPDHPAARFHLRIRNGVFPIKNPKSTIGNPSSPWPSKLPAQVTLLRQLLATDPTATPEQLSVRFGRKNPKRTEQIEGMIETLKELGQV